MNNLIMVLFMINERELEKLREEDMGYKNGVNYFFLKEKEDIGKDVVEMKDDLMKDEFEGEKMLIEIVIEFKKIYS